MVETIYRKQRIYIYLCLYQREKAGRKQEESKEKTRRVLKTYMTKKESAEYVPSDLVGTETPWDKEGSIVFMLCSVAVDWESGVTRLGSLESEDVLGRT